MLIFKFFLHLFNSFCSTLYGCQLFYGISKKDLWGAYEWTWDIVDFFVKSIHCPL